MNTSITPGQQWRTKFCSDYDRHGEPRVVTVESVSWFGRVTVTGNASGRTQTISSTTLLDRYELVEDGEGS